MKQLVMLFLVGVLLLAVTSCGTTSTSSMRHYMLNLEINPFQEDDRLISHELYLDGAFIGHFTPDKSNLWLYPGEHTIKVVSEGFETQERTINIIGNSNVQSLNINLDRDSQGTEKIEKTEGAVSTEGTEETESTEEPESIVNNNITLTWDTSVSNTKDIAGYKIYYGTSQGNYTESIDVGNVTTYTFQDMPSGTWYFVITAYDASGNESNYSDVVKKTFE